MNCYPFIEAEKAGRRNVARACALLKVSRAACCQHQAGPSQRERADAELTGQITAVHKGSRGRYGAPRVHAELREVEQVIEPAAGIGRRPTVKLGLHPRYPRPRPLRDILTGTAIRQCTLRHCSLLPFPKPLPPFAM